MEKTKKRVAKQNFLPKALTGIKGFDEITGGGLPKGRPTLVAGTAGCGKTVFGMEFLVRGALEHDEPGVFVAFEETEQDLTKNFASLGFDLPDLIRRKKLAVEYVYIERSEIEETGEYDLSGLFIRLAQAIDQVKAKRIVLDTIEVLFSGLSNAAILRAELRRLFSWLKKKGLTAIVTGERGATSSLTRYGLEEYVADCVIMLDNRVTDQISTRRLRIIKYRGSRHATNEFPFMIDEQGLSILPITSLELKHIAPTVRVSTGIESLDGMLGGRGFYRGSSVLVSGTAGSGKTSIGAHFIAAACRRGERCLWFAFEESSSQITRNMRSIGIDLEPLLKKGLLQICSERPTAYGLEMHLVAMHRQIDDKSPSVVFVDPLTNLISTGNQLDVKAMLTRLIDYLKVKKITTLFSTLTGAGGAIEQSGVGISSLMDTWILLRESERNNERTRGLSILKSRGMAHSNRIREFALTGNGIQLPEDGQ